MRLLGLDPGLLRTGWGLIEARGNALHFVAAGIVMTDPADALAIRLDALYRGHATLRLDRNDARISEAVLDLPLEPVAAVSASTA